MSQNLIRITKRFSFEMGHALHNYDGKCRYIHGHSYKMFVTLLGKVAKTPGAPKDGMVIDFSVLKKIINEKIIEVYDHSLVVNENDDRDFTHPGLNERTIMFPVQPTCENILIHLKDIVVKELPEELTLVNMKLYETEDSYAEWDLSDQ